MKKWLLVFTLCLLMIASLVWGQSIPSLYPVVPQPTTPGIDQPGNIHITGTIIADTGLSGPLSGSATSLKSPATTGLLTTTGMGAGTTRNATVPDSDFTILYDGKASATFGTASSATGSVIFKNISNANAFIIQPGATGAALSWTLPIAAPGGNNYLLNASTAGVLGYTDPATFALVGQTMYLGTTGVAINRGSGALSLSGVSIDGNAGTVTSGVYTSGSYSDPSWITALAGTKINGFSAGQIPYMGASFLTSSADLIWDGTNKLLGVGASASLTQKITVQSAGNLGISLRQGTTADRLILFVGDGTGGRIADDNYIQSSATALHFLNSNTEVFTLTSTNNIGINGATTLGTDAVGVLGIKNGTAPTSAPADIIQIYSADGASGAVFSCYQEYAPYAGVGVASTHKIPVIWNGTAYYILATTVQ